MGTLERAITTISPLSEKSMELLLNKWQYWVVPKDQLLLREKSVSDYIYFIEEGIVRIYYFKEGKEITEWLAMDKEFFLSITSFFERTPSHLLIQTIEPSIIRGIHHNDLMQLADERHDIERLLRKMVTSSLILSQKRMDSLQFESALQRYQKMLENAPDFINRVPVHYIASFLGITKETLSRIRGLQ